MQRQCLLERRRKGHHPVLASLALGDPDPAGVEVDVVEADGDELGDADAGVEQGLDEHDVAAPTLLPHRLVVAADLEFLEPGDHGPVTTIRSRTSTGIPRSWAL